VRGKNSLGKDVFLEKSVVANQWVTELNQKSRTIFPTRKSYPQPNLKEDEG